MNRTDLFWKVHEKNLQTTISDSLKNLLTSMLQYEPENRLDLEQIIEHKWTKKGQLERVRGPQVSG